MPTTAEFLKQHPICCFCGGQMPSSSIDHQPPKIVFPQKHRPKGMEFPACDRCNGQTRGDEALLAFVCRFAGSRRADATKDFDRLKDIVRSVELSFPGLHNRMHGQRLWANERGVWVRVGSIDVNQPEVHQAFCRMAAKLALAIYYEIQTSPASVDVQIDVQWTHCQNADTFKHVQNIIEALPNEAILQAGKWDTQDSFFLKYHFENGQLFSVAIFHNSVALIARLREPKVPRQEGWGLVMAPSPKGGIVVLP